MDNTFIETKPINTYWEYLRTINWSEPWLIGLCGFHIISLLIIVLTRGYHNVQMLIFLGLLSCIYWAESINELAAKKWKLFAEDQYFDSRGMFISTVLSFPVIINCCILVCIWLYESIYLLKICVKRLKKTRIEKINKNETDNKTKKE